MAQSLFKRRWYDSNSHISGVVYKLEKAPTNIQTILCKSIVTLAEDHFNAEELSHQLRSLGIETLTKLQQSKSKRRLYDTHPLFHKSMNYFMTIPFEDRNKLAQQAEELVDYTFEYFEVCRKNDHTVHLNEVIALNDIYIEEGVPGVVAFFKRIRTMFAERKRQRSYSIVDDRIKFQG